MKSIISKAMLVATGLFCFSFGPRPGGEGYEVYLNNKLVVQKFGGDMKDVKSVDLKSISSTDRLTVKYWHCGKLGKNRTVTLKNSSNAVIKTFHYPDTQSITSMEVPLKDVHVAARLFYSSSELPAGRALLVINPAVSLSKR